MNKDRIIREEQGSLHEVIEKLDNIKERLDGQISDYIWESKQARESVNNDEIVKTIMSAKGIKDTKENREKLIKARKELYDVRAVVEVTSEDGTDVEELRIGYNTYVDGADILVNEWNKPICRPFWGGQCPEYFETDFRNEKGENFHISVKLKQLRMLKLWFSHVSDAVHMFPLEKEKQEQLIVDMLTEDLKKRRSGDGWRNIIRTIEQTQKDIVLAPFRKNIVVQGCAGSGKTMIMLHRLPILLFDNQDTLKRNEIYIISPSEPYIQTAYLLCRDLKIDDLYMHTLNQYYDHCLRKYTVRNSEYGRISPTVKLDEEQTEYVYSKKMIEDIVSALENSICFESVDFDKANNMFGLKKVDWNQGEYSDRLLKRTQEISNILTENSKVLRRYFNATKTLIDEYKRIATFFGNLYTVITQFIRQKITISKNEIAKTLKELQTLDEVTDMVAIQSLNEKVDGLEKKIKVLEDKLAEVIDEYEGKDPAGYFRTVERYKSDIDAFVKSLPGNILSDMDSNKISTVYEFIEKKNLLNNFTDKFKMKIDSLEDKYFEYMNSVQDEFNKVISAQGSLNQINEQYLDIQYYQDIKLVQQKLNTASNSVVKSTYRDILAKLDLTKEELNKNLVPFCGPYIYLQILYQYKGAPNSATDTLISIDEAQSIAPEELRLISNINRNKCIFNLFGDVNQHIEGSKGVDDWSEYSDIVPLEKTEIDLNYRNAEEIVKYCVKRFGTKMTAVNTPGKGWHELSSNNFKTEMEKRFLNIGAGGTTAIIVKDRYEAKYILDEFRAYESKLYDLTGENYSVNMAKWNIITVDDAKGLEFNSVLVLAGRMTKHEQYIACTRALAELLIYDEVIDISPYAELEETESDAEVLTSEISEMKNNTVDKKKEKPERFKAKKEGKTALHLFFEKMGFTVIDNRDDGGYLWVLGKDDMLKKAVDAAQKKFGYVPGQYDKNPDVGFKDGFCTKSKK